ncbi:MAG: DUF1565 domain-containing protein, partial [Anaerolineales bacterium]|nr:DUF1565 domain-containing protein [Anaerolineales bacterium]
MNFVRNGVVYKINHIMSLLFLAAVITVVSQLYAPLSKAQPAATTFRVATTGTDSKSCGPVSDPCRTIQKAVNNAGSGDTILVAAGTYNYSGSSTCLDSVNTAVVCVLSKHLTILGGYTTSNWSVADPTANVTIIDGGNAHRGVQLHGPTAN